MAEPFDSFNAPQFVDFSKDLHFDEDVETYFEVDHESEDILATDNIEAFFSPLPEADIGQELINHPDQSNKGVRTGCLRRSLSVGNIEIHSEKQCKNEIINICKDTEILEISTSSEETQSSKTNGCDTTLEARPAKSESLRRWASKEHLNKLAQPKKRQFVSDENLSRGQFVSLAESVKKFQNSTPERFRSRPKLTTLKNTIPQSPALLTKTRSRPVHILSQAEREQLEYESAQKFKIKAHPVSKRILQGPLKPTVPIEKKPNTVPEPFNLTKPPKKIIAPKPEMFEFHAKPVPKSVLEPPKYKELEKKFTRPETPTFMKQFIKDKSKETKDVIKKETTSQEKPSKTVVVPFSFEERNKRMLKKKEEFVNKVLEDEKKAREFHARPIPKSIIKPAKQNSFQKSGSFSGTVSNNRHTKSDENISTILNFKAKPPMVLYKEPFVPVKEERPLTAQKPFQLKSEIRAKEREEFEQQKKDKEERLKLIKQLEEEERLRQEEEEKAELRKKTDYKAQPIKKYKEVKIEPSGKVTQPISPKFATDRIRNKENMPQNNIC